MKEISEQQPTTEPNVLFEQGLLRNGAPPDVARNIGAAIADFTSRQPVPLTIREAVNMIKLEKAEAQLAESKIDTKTGLPMEEVFMADLEALVKRLSNKRSTEKRFPVVLLADAVGLKKVNDTIGLGREQGDVVIKTIAAVLGSRSRGRTTDAAYRYGESADEFAEILHGVKPDPEDGTYETTIRKIIERKQEEVKAALRKAGLPVDKMNLGVRIVGARLRNGEGAEEFMQRLDQMLIKQKKAERRETPHDVDPRLV